MWDASGSTNVLDWLHFWGKILYTMVIFICNGKILILGILKI